MPDIGVAPSNTKAMDDWLIALDPRFAPILAQAKQQPQQQPKQQGAAEPEEGAIGGGLPELKLKREVLKLKLVEHETKYGSLKIEGTVTAEAVPAADGKQAAGKPFSLGDAEASGLLELSISNVDVDLKADLSGTEMFVGATVTFEAHTKLFKTPAKSVGKATLLKVSGSGGVSLPSVVFTLTQTTTMEAGGAKVTVTADFKASYAVSKEKVFKAIGLDVLKKVAKEALEKEAKRLGVKVLGREAAELVLKDLGPIAAAFSVGLDIGALLNEYTVAPKVAKVVIEDIMGDFADRYNDADTLGKMWLVSKNSPRIAAALVAAGVLGAASGVADVVLFKLLGLDKLKDYAEALIDFAKGVSAAMAAIREAIENGVGGTMLYGALMLGIKCNPKHAICAHGDLEPVIAALYAKLHPLYGAGGYEKIIMVRVQDAKFDAARFQKFAKFVHEHGKPALSVDFTSEQTVAATMKSMGASEFLAFLHFNKLIRWDVKTDGEMDPDKIDPKLLDELFG